MAPYPYYSYPMPMYQPQQPMMDNLAQLRQNQMQPQNTLLGRVVSDVAEARAVPSDLNGQPMFFPDLAHNAIHMKVFNPATGVGDFYTFQLVQNGQQGAQKAVQRPAAAQVRYATEEDVQALQGQITGIREDLNKVLAKPQQQEAMSDD